MTTMEAGGISLFEAPPEFDKFTEVEVLFYYDGPLFDELDPEAIPQEGSFLHIHEEKS